MVQDSQCWIEVVTCGAELNYTAVQCTAVQYGIEVEVCVTMEAVVTILELSISKLQPLLQSDFYSSSFYRPLPTQVPVSNQTDWPRLCEARNGSCWPHPPNYSSVTGGWVEWKPGGT